MRHHEIPPLPRRVVPGRRALGEVLRQTAAVVEIGGTTHVGSEVARPATEVRHSAQAIATAAQPVVIQVAAHARVDLASARMDAIRSVAGRVETRRAVTGHRRIAIRREGQPAHPARIGRSVAALGLAAVLRRGEIGAAALAGTIGVAASAATGVRITATTGDLMRPSVVTGARLKRRRRR